MAQLLCIDFKSYRDGLNNVNDIINVREDSHRYSEHEKNIFNVVTVKGTRAEVEKQINEHAPEISVAYKDGDDWTTNEKETEEKKEIWKDGDDWKELNKRPKYPVRRTLAGFAENYSDKAENNTLITITDVRSRGTS
ncbi:MAG: hypothetical protein GY853_02280 [PVC group bacterium]|nr:hypothetical protein [PVC group bacterium]